MECVSTMTSLPVREKPLLDRFRRPMTSLRISVTDRCNLRCRYCMPEDEYAWVERKELLTFEEIAALTEAFTSLGVRRVRLTGGEPLLRHDLARLIRMLARTPLVEDLALTTNGILLARSVEALRDAGLKRVTISLDSLDPIRFRAIARSNAHAAVIEGIEAAVRGRFESVKINAVVMRGINDDEIEALLEFGCERNVEVRFIEYMDVGGATRWTMDQVVTRDEILSRIERRFGPVVPVIPARESDRRQDGRSKAPADRFALQDGTVFGVISSTSQPFCGSCDRSRLTPDGVWLLCLYASSGIDLKSPLRDGAPTEAIARMIEQAWTARSDRGAEDRKALAARGILFRAEELRKNPRLEMHTRGG